MKIEDPIFKSKRKFNGKTYKYYDHYSNKKEAKTDASDLKDRGTMARVLPIKTKGCDWKYKIYYRYK